MTLAVEPGGGPATGKTQAYLVFVQAFEPEDPNSNHRQPLPPEWLAINGHTLVSTGMTNEDDLSYFKGAVWGVTVVQGPAGVPVAATPVATQVFDNFNDVYSGAYASNLDLRIIDANNGTDLTAQTNTVIVGQQINLKCQLSMTNQFMANFPLSGFQWTVPGNTFSDYVATAESAVLYTNFPTDNSNAVFYWSDDGLKQVQISATVDGKTVTGRATFNVVRPTAKITTETTSVNVDTFLNELGFHDTNTFQDGITFTNAMTIPSGFSGTNEWVQIVLNPYRAQLDTNSVLWVYTPNGAAPYLDTSYPYTNANVIATIAVDSPNVALSSGYSEITMSNSFKMWLMFKPDGGQWIPLRTVTWNCNGTATNSGTSWILTSRSWSANPSDADAGTTFPQWNSNVKNATYQIQP